MGLWVMDELVARGKKVTLVNGTGKMDEELLENVNIMAGDATDNIR